VLFPTPKERRVELLEPTKFLAKLEEPVLPGDPATSQRAEQLPTYNSYSGEGDVTAPLVYVNYGVPADYEELDRRGISVRGAIVMLVMVAVARHRPLAAEKGAVGCIIYRPARRRLRAGLRYPAGPWRPKDGCNAQCPRLAGGAW
jgi:N-acetylated-alpha-linked acidic dipeptidase